MLGFLPTAAGPLASNGLAEAPVAAAQGGFTSPLAFFGGIASPAVTMAGYRGLLAFWAGGGAKVSQAGYRGLLAFWAGGAAPGEAEEVVLPGGGGVAQLPRPFPVEGVGYGILPELEGEAHGVVIAAGDGAGQFPKLTGEAVGSVGVAGRSAAQILVRAAAVGDRGQRGTAVAVLKGAMAQSSGRVGIHGEGFGMIMKFNGAANGRHDDDEAAIVAILLAA